MQITCLSLWEPYASLVAWGAKRVETRSWAWQGHLPAVLAIHAAKFWSRQTLREARCSPAIMAALGARGVRWSSGAGRRLSRPSLAFGQVTAVVRLVECVNTSFLHPPGTHGVPCLAAKYLKAFPDEAHFGDYTPGRYAWALDRVIPVEPPRHVTGRQGLFRWEVPPALAEAVLKSLCVCGVEEPAAEHSPVCPLAGPDLPAHGVFL